MRFAFRELPAPSNRGLRAPRRHVAPTALLSAALLAASASAPTASAAEPELAVSGWGRARYHYWNGVPVDRTSRDTDVEYLDYRFVVDPVVTLGDTIALKGRLSLVDDALLGNNETGASILSGLVRGISNVELTGDTDFPERLEPLDDLEVQRLWTEIRTPVGLVRIGRQPSAFGLGILSNGGTELELGPAGNGPVSGDTLDRIQLVTDLARLFAWDGETWIASLAFDRAVENDVAFERDDVHQLVLATLSTNGTMAPRVVGSREAGAYVVWVTNDRYDADVLLADGYFHLEAGGWFVEGEGVVGTGTTRRGGLIPGEDKATIEDDLASGLAEDFVETLNGTLSIEDAEDFARNGFPPFLQTFVATELFDIGFSEEVSLTIAERGVGAALPTVFDEEIDVLVYGGVVRAGFQHEALRVTAELGYGSPPADDDFVTVRVGPEGAEDDDEDFEIVDAVDDVVGERALTGRSFEAYPFDSEYDVALLLYDVVGPINPASGVPGVFNTTYGKVTGEWRWSDTVTTYAAVLAGWLNRSVTLSSNRAFPDEPVRYDVEDEDDPREVVTHERYLGFELDAGAIWRPHPNLIAELKAGYLVSGPTFGPNEADVFGIRPQVAVLF